MSMTRNEMLIALLVKDDCNEPRIMGDRARAKALAEIKDFNPKQPRDSVGRWARTGGNEFTRKLAFHVETNPDEGSFLRALHPEHGEVGYIAFDHEHESLGSHPSHIGINDVNTWSQFRGRGVASALMRELERRYPGVPIDHGSVTDAGAAWHRRYYGSTSRYTLNGKPLKL